MAVTIGARLEQVWSWLVQSGSDRVAAPLLRQRLQPMLERDMVNIEDRLEAGGDQLPKPGKDI